MDRTNRKFGRTSKIPFNRRPYIQIHHTLQRRGENNCNKKRKRDMDKKCSKVERFIGGVNISQAWIPTE